MKKKPQSGSALLRKQAEELLSKEVKKSIGQLTEAETYKLLHELQVHQIELESQNDELIQAKEQALIASEKYIELYDFAPSGYFTLSPKGNIIGLNLTGAKMLGKDRLQIQNRLFQLFLSDSSKPLFRRFLEKVFGSNIIETCDVALSVNGSSPMYVHLSGYAAENGEQCLITVFDITKQKQTEIELTDLKIHAEKAQLIAEEARYKAETATYVAEDAVKSKQQFLANMSHEIRTPMNAVIGFTNVLLKTKLNKTQNKYLNAIKVSGESLIVLINDILDIAKVDARKMTFEKIPFSLFDSISIMHQLFDLKIKEKNLDMFDEYDKAIPQILVGDPMRFRQIILNLMSNALKFTSQGKISLRVRLIKEDAEKVTIEFALTDTGIGIREDRLSQVFNKFEQADKDTSSSYGGTGLGLAIVKQMVEQQGGTVFVSSELTKGSTFGFILSFEKTNPKFELKKELGSETVQDSTFFKLNLKSTKVLIAEDVELNQLLIKIIMLDFGFDIDIASNGQIAIEKLKKNDYDIILMDLQMPVMNGFDATEYIRNKMNSQIPIIALTADVTNLDVEKCKTVGMNDYISKPIDENLLFSKIMNCLSNKREVI